MYYLYKHTSPSNKVYIGITAQNPTRRWKSGCGYNHNLWFKRAIDKYTWKSFTHEILFEGLSKELAMLLEQAYIKYYKEQGRSYNITDGGEGTLGVTIPEAQRLKISASLKEYYQQFGSPNKGRVLSEEHKKKLSYSHKGKIPANLDKLIYNNKHNHPLKGTHRSEETKRKLSRPVIQLTLDNQFVAEYDGVKQAMNQTRIWKLIDCCKGKIPSAGGYKWEYKYVINYGD